jgi:hypothetical protein
MESGQQLVSESISPLIVVSASRVEGGSLLAGSQLRLESLCQVDGTASHIARRRSWAGVWRSHATILWGSMAILHVAAQVALFLTTLRGLSISELLSGSALGLAEEGMVLLVVTIVRVVADGAQVAKA